ncbi:MAG: BrnT family toxin [SAR324 cluster bacterium]|nr:BrnT family toxin [SAR324 cluster bacterium]
MIFEWDEQKNHINFEKHGIPFEYASRVFIDEHRIEWIDSRKEYKEVRCVTMGTIENRVFVVVFTQRENIKRLISARKANERETRKYYEIHT